MGSSSSGTRNSPVSETSLFICYEICLSYCRTSGKIIAFLLHLKDKRINGDPYTFQMSLSPEAQKTFAGDGLVAVVTGGGSGIGAMIARALAANGASAVYILGLPDDPLEDIAKQTVRT